MNPTPNRRRALRVAAAMLACAVPIVARSQDAWPSRTVRVVVGFPPGQTTDVIARAVASVLAKQLSREVVIDNRPGAAGILGAQAVRNAAPDGYSLLVSSSGPIAINPALYKKLPYDSLKDFIPIAPTGASPVYLVVNASFPASNFAEFVAHVRANPGKVSYGSGGVGITAHLAMEMLKKTVGLDILHVPYKGSTQALNDLIGGQVAMMFDAGATVLPMVRAGKVKAIGVASRERVKTEPNLPTLIEQGLRDFEATAWSGLFAPQGTPAAIVERLSAEVRRATHSPEVTQVLRASGAERMDMSQAEFAAFVSAEVAKWGKAAKDAGIEPE